MNNNMDILRQCSMEQLDELISNPDLYAKYGLTVEPGLEVMLRYIQFYLFYVVRRTSDLNRVVPLSNIQAFPQGAILHIIDNLNAKPGPDVLMTPDMNNPLLALTPERKYIYHVTNYYQDAIHDVVKPDMTGIRLPTIGVIPAINTFRQQHLRLYKQVMSMSDIQLQTNWMGVVNYNSLFRGYMAGGQLHRYRLLNFVFANLINTINKAPADRYHFVQIALTTAQFTRAQFMRTFKEHSKATIAFPNTPHYLFLMQLVDFVKCNCSTSVFEAIPKELLPKIIFILTVDKNCIMYNLHDLLAMNGDTDAILIRFINHLNLLAQSGIQYDGEGNAVNEVVLEPEAIDEEDDTVITDTATVPIEAPAIVPTQTVDKAVNLVEQAGSHKSEEKDTINHELIEVKEQINKNTPGNKAEKGADVIPTKPVLVELDEQSQDIIDNSVTPMTVAQKTKVEEIAVAYKDIVVGGETIAKILTKPLDHSIPTNDLDFMKDDIIDKSMLTSSVKGFDKAYVDKTMKRDLVETLASFNNNGMFLTSIAEETVVDELNQLKKYNVTYTDSNRKNHLIKFTLPTIDENGNCYINGALKEFKKQRVNKPICKVSPVRVTLNSNFNKTIVERNTSVAHSFASYFPTLLGKSKLPVEYEYGTVETPGIVLPYEYTVLSSKYTKITIGTTKFLFDYPNRFAGILPAKTKLLTDIEKVYGVYIGNVASDSSKIYCLKLNGLLTIVDITKIDSIEKTTLIDMVSKLIDVDPNPLHEWCELKILDKNLTLALVLCYRFGLMNMLKYLHTPFAIYEGNRGKDWDPLWDNPSYIKIKFKGKTLIINRVPMITSLIFAGLQNFDLSEITLEEMDDKDIYYDLIQSKKLSINYLKGIDSFFELFIDPITKDVLRQMHEPTNVRDLLIRAVTLLTTEDHLPAASSANFRFRSHERMIGIVYNEMARALSTYRNKSVGATNKFSVKYNAINMRIMQDELMTNVNTINPINDLNSQTVFSHIGQGGRSADTFMIDDRRYPADGIGIISEATVASGSVAINAALSADPKIINTRGMTEDTSVEDVQPAQLLSITSLLMPCVTHDD